MSDSFYRAFEDRHRGSRELIKSRLGVYAPFLQPVAALYQPARAIDLGCGRGEWLEILGEHGFDAYGVDLDEGMLEGCRERNLNARRADAITSLRELPDASMALVSAFHLAEHLPFDVARTMIAEALRVLQPGGLLILETPNPENLVVGSSSFYQDPSHERPLPPELLRFAVEHAGFGRAKVLGLQEARELRDAPAPGLLDVINGVSPDYAVVAQKDGDAAAAAALDAPFSVDYGLTLETLARRYDDQANRRQAELIDLLHEAEVRLVRHGESIAGRVSHLETVLPMAQRIVKTEARLADIQAQTAAAEARAALVEAQLADVHARIAAAETRAAQSDERLQALLASRSWRATAPLRLTAGILHRLRAAAREGRLGSAAKNRAKSALRRTGFAVMSEPRLRQHALALLNRFPAVKNRLRNIMLAPAAAPAPGGTQAPSSLSPRAARIYSELKKAIDARKN